MSEVTNAVIAVGACRPHPQNYNQHSAAQLGDLRASLRQFGQVRSIVVQDDAAGGYLLVAGHGLWEAARAEGFTELRADVIPADWLPVKVLAYLAADNELGRASDPDEVQLAQLTSMLLEADATLARLAAGSAERLTELLTIADATSQPAAESAISALDAAEALLAKWGVQAGDIWQAGDQYILCGDCRDAAAWVGLLAAAQLERVQLVLTSPPYAQQREAEYGGIPEAEYVDWWEAVQAQVRAHLAPDGSFCVNIKPHATAGQRVLYVFDLVLAMVRRWGWAYLDELIWYKTGTPGGWPNRLQNAFEPVYLFTPTGDLTYYLDEVESGASEASGTPPFFDEAGRVYHFAGRTQIKFRPKAVGEYSEQILVYTRAGKYKESPTGNIANLVGHCRRGIARPANVLKVQVNQEKQPHSAMYPVGLPAFFIKLLTDPGDAVLDPFCGAGTTLVAAHQAGRRGLGIEYLPRHVAVIVERLAGLGLTPVRLAAGEAGTEEVQDGKAG